MPVSTPTDRPRRASALPPEERRAAIVAAALPLLLEHGDRVSTRQIADAAGIAEGTIFRAFGDKDAVVAAVIEAVMDRTALEERLGAIDPALPLRTALEAAALAIQARVLTIHQLVTSVGPQWKPLIQRPFEPSTALLGLFRAHRAEIAVPPAEAARHFQALTLAASHPLLTDRPVKTAELVHRFLHGVAAGRPSC